MSVTEARKLEDQWQDFSAFADRRLQRAGRCHESEVYTAFRRELVKYRYGQGGVSMDDAGVLPTAVQVVMYNDTPQSKKQCKRYHGVAH